MDQPNLEFYVTSAYLITGLVVFAIVVASIWRFQRAKRNLAALKRDNA